MRSVRFRLKTLSPVHIRHGLGEPAFRQRKRVDKPATYKMAFFEQDDAVFRVDQKALHRMLLRLDEVRCRELKRDRQEFVFVRAYADYCARESEPSIRGFFRELETLVRDIGLKWEEDKFFQVIKTRDQQEITLTPGSFISGAEQDSFFIPGSSIKGALRTAVLYGILRSEHRLGELQNHAQYRIDYTIAERERQRDPRKPRDPRFSEERVKEHLGWIDSLFRQITPLDPTGKPLSIERGAEALKDLMKAVFVSDSSRFEETQVPERKCIVVNNRNGHLQARFDLPVRCFEGICEVEIGVDEHMLERFRSAIGQGLSLPFENVNDLIQCAEIYARDMWTEERKYYADIQTGERNSQRNLDLNPRGIEAFYHQREQPTLRIGWGSGLFGTTVVSLLPEPLRNTLRDEVISKDGPRPWYPAPSSRRLIRNEGHQYPYLPLGWIQLAPLDVKTQL